MGESAQTAGKAYRFFLCDVIIFFGILFLRELKKRVKRSLFLG